MRLSNPGPFLPKVEVLQGHRVVDIACGSGDAQTLCLTDDDTVWSWGDGDYGKLGRGGSDGCKVPMKVSPVSIALDPLLLLPSVCFLALFNFIFICFAENILAVR